MAVLAHKTVRQPISCVSHLDTQIVYLLQHKNTAASTAFLSSPGGIVIRQVCWFVRLLVPNCRQCRIKILEAMVLSEKMRPPKIQRGDLGERCELPQRVWGGAPAEIEFGVL